MQENTPGIIIVEDQAITALALKNMLEVDGFTVLGCYNNGKAALEAARNLSPDLMLVDIILPGEYDGIRIAAELGNSIPIIFMSGQATTELFTSMLSQNSYGFLKKPIQRQELNFTLRMALQRSELDRKLRHSEEKLKLATQVLELLNQSDEQNDAISTILFIIKSYSGIESVGIRLKDGDTFPLYESYGYEEDYFLARANHPECSSARTGCSEDSGFACLCGTVLGHNYEQNSDYFTPAGSFWTNRLSELSQLNNIAGETLDIINICGRFRYESVAIIPLISESGTIGVLQLSDRRWDFFTPETILFYERIASSIGIALARQRSETALRNSGEKLRKAQRLAHLGFFEMYLQQQTVYLSEEAVYLLRLPQQTQQLSVRTFLQMILPADRKSVMKKIRTLLIAPEREEFVCRVKRSAVDIRHLRVLAESVTDKSGQVIVINGTFYDITSERTAINQLRSAFRKGRELEQIINRSSVISFTFRDTGNWPIDFVSDNIQLLGHAPNEFYFGKKGLLDIVHPDDRPFVKELIASEQEKGFTKISMEFRILTHDDFERWIECIIWPRNSRVEKKQLQGIVTDITARKKAYDLVRESEVFLKNIIEGIQASIVLINPENNRVIDVNAHAENLFGLTRVDLLKQFCYDIMPCPEKNCSRELITQEHEYIIQRSDKTNVPVRVTAINTTFGGNPTRIIILFDISSQKALERQLNLAQKMESIGQLAAGIAHEINTPIQYIGDNTQFLQDAFNDLLKLIDAFDQQGDTEAVRQAVDLDFIRHEVPEAITQTLQGVRHVASIVLAMKRFSHPDVEEMQIADINDIIRNTVTISRNEWKYVAELLTDLDPELPGIYCHPNELGQVFLNMIVNAAHAVTDAKGKSADLGTIRITTENLENAVRIRITDSGTGIKPEHIAKIFDPFFTTKDVGKGTGQGLAICHSVIVQKHGGSIDVTSTPGEGTEFIIVLPFNQKE